uniref:Uncharacterized protein n=1 Tax=Sphaerodactylus townsendi TaxID=933632 RepID=A0ACB8EDE4_9SAUR
MRRKQWKLEMQSFAQQEDPTPAPPPHFFHFRNIQHLGCCLCKQANRNTKFSVTSVDALKVLMPLLSMATTQFPQAEFFLAVCGNREGSRESDYDLLRRSKQKQQFFFVCLLLHCKRDIAVPSPVWNCLTPVLPRPAQIRIKFHGHRRWATPSSEWPHTVY